ncbi:hypothetical protein [Sphingobacterium sp. ML3W]|uniref:hypothetical protein n=1 Tax=Sphingobacterium sp. ML3W TaxID=1538644 RepID=UPI00068EAC09|nr:hypothetical protein [Sphingobacterium sp. ML3W]
MANNRHNFTAKTIEILGKRVGLICSNPACSKTTSGPHTDAEKATIVGVAAHISAAAAGGPRYNATLDEKERKSAKNGIWLCVNCSTIIDKDPDAYSATLLEGWKNEAEKRTDKQLKGIITSTKDIEKLAHIDLDLIWLGNSRINRGYSIKNHDIYGDKPIQAGGPVIIHWQLKWFYSIVIYNNSGFHAYNLKIIPRNTDLTFEKLPAKNNLQALGSLELESNFTKRFEGKHNEADDLLSPTFPQELLDGIFDVYYTDDTRKPHLSSFMLTSEGFIKI